MTGIRSGDLCYPFTQISVSLAHMISRLIISVSVLAVILCTAGCARNSKSSEKISTPTEVRADATTNVPEKAKNTGSDDAVTVESKLKGRWMRSDGNYILQVFAVSADSTLNAGYYNPGQINVESGEWLKQDGRLFIRIVLRDVNYPGSTYILEYQPQGDFLSGNYFQAVDGVNYDVTFTREK